MCRDRVRKAKAHLKLNLVKDMSSSHKGYYGCIILKGKVSQNMGSLLNGAGKVEKKDMVKIEIFNSLFTLFLTAKIFLHKSQTLETREKVWSKEDLPSAEEDDLRQCINWTHTNLLDILDFSEATRKRSILEAQFGDQANK